MSCECEHDDCCCMDDPVIQYHLSEDADFQAPREGDAGFDLRALEEVVLQPGDLACVSTGVRVAIPEGWVGIVKDRSSMALKAIFTHAGVIDAGYRGELKIVITNNGKETYTIEKGAKFAQMIVIPCNTNAERVATVDELGATERGAGGFGSTGK